MNVVCFLVVIKGEESLAEVLEKKSFVIGVIEIGLLVELNFLEEVVFLEWNFYLSIVAVVRFVILKRMCLTGVTGIGQCVELGFLKGGAFCWYRFDKNSICAID